MELVSKINIIDLASKDGYTGYVSRIYLFCCVSLKCVYLHNISCWSTVFHLWTLLVMEATFYLNSQRGLDMKFEKHSAILFSKVCYEGFPVTYDNIASTKYLGPIRRFSLLNLEWELVINHIQFHHAKFCSQIHLHLL